MRLEYAARRRRFGTRFIAAAVGMAVATSMGAGMVYYQQCARSAAAGWPGTDRLNELNLREGMYQAGGSITALTAAERLEMKGLNVEFLAELKRST